MSEAINLDTAILALLRLAAAEHKERAKPELANARSSCCSTTAG